ncbi:MAG: Uncharacterized protein family UPF0005 [Roseibaca calidilacus]|uniref:Uncharacterized protein family UPF0005 n=1 Tax=Roseibaca calidilacus TaxID=1666912 RepID=A0A0P7YUN2_9RHOB|nr:TrgA family protein [Roseibaca calidilacus]KPP94215.1 MAG: Uncharacterized protein family UPF0005 [Roseibaca calidilacus]CUX81362.1 hypothetical protein Ga0058931_1715 [Roseibaca calidilacus]
MSAQPTLTRLFAMLVFAAMAVYVATSFQALQEGARVSGSANAVAGTMGALSGWLVAGPRIDGRWVQSVFAMVQGVIVATLLTLAAGATVETFRLGYQTRHRDLDDAMQGFFHYIAEEAPKLATPEISIPLGLFCLVGGVVLAVLCRAMEARRTAR